MKRKTLSLTIALCLVFSLFTWCGLTSTAEDFAPPGSESSIDREPDMRYTQTCYIIPDSVNVAVGQSEYIQTSMGDHQIEHYTFFRWTSSDTSVATVDEYGNVTGVAPGTATINLAFTTPGHMEYDSCEVEVIPIAEGTYFIKNKQTQKYADIENQSMSSGTRIHQWSFHGDLSQRWIFEYIGNGYYTIKSANSSTPFYLGVQNDSAAADTTIVLRTGSITDGMKWKVSQTSSGAYKLTAKCGESNNRVLAVGWSILGINIDGIDIEQRDYSNDSDYIDEWLIKSIYNASVYNYYDRGYYIYYEENSDVSVEKIKQYLNDVSTQYLKLFGLKINTGSISYYNSPIDICKGTVTTSNIDSLCSHSGTVHTERNNVISAFNGTFSGNNTVTNVLWSGHRITSTASNGTINYNRSCSSGTSIFIIKRILSTDRNRDSKGVLMHELNHQYGANDHYHETDEEGNCKWPDICSTCNGAHSRPSSCIMNNSRVDIFNSNVICNDCKNEIINHLNNHHLVNN